MELAHILEHIIHMTRSYELEGLVCMAQSWTRGLVIFLATVISIATGSVAPVQSAVEESQPDLISVTCIVYKHDGYQHTILRSDFAPVSLSRSIGWVMPVPNEPLRYGSLSTDVVDDAWRWVGEIARQRQPGDDARAHSPSALPSASADVEGDREIDLLQDVDALDRWCDTNDLERFSRSSVEPYTSGWTFVAQVVHSKPNALPPNERVSTGTMYVTFPTDKIILPERFLTDYGSFHLVVIAATDQPLNMRDADAYGFVPLDEAAIRRQDQLIMQAGASDSSRAILWYDLGTLLYDSERLPTVAAMPGGRTRSFERDGHWLNKRTRDFKEAPINRLTAFNTMPDTLSELGTILEIARRDNAGDAPTTVTEEYRRLTQSAGIESMDSLYVTALVSPMFNTPNTQSDLSHWNSDPEFRTRDLLTALPPLTAPWSQNLALDDSTWAQPAAKLLPKPDALHDFFTTLMGVTQVAHMEELSQQILQQDQASPQLHLYRQLVSSGRSGLVLNATTNDSLGLPDQSLPAHHPRSSESFERALRSIRSPLLAAWVAAQYTPTRPNPLVAVLRLKVHPSGSVELLTPGGNVPDGLPTRLFEIAVETGMQMAPYERETICDIPLLIEE
jgi:hypothetical protein